MRLSKSVKEKIMCFAEKSIYRLNAKSADCYAFNLYRNAKGCIDFSGGWDWQRNIVDKNAEWLYVFSDNSFRKVGQ